MSFKRDGDDKSLLSVLRKRRVTELFAENIPDDEAQMLSNGKLTCTVCHYKPVFDTIQVLTQHRSGKKHLENVKRAKEKKEELRKLIEIRQQNEILQNRSTVLTGISRTSAAPLLTGAPYEARVMKSKLKSHERKPTINLSNASTNGELYLGAAKIPFGLLKNSLEAKAQSLKPYARRTGKKDGTTSWVSTERKNDDCRRGNVFKSDCLSTNAETGQSSSKSFAQIQTKAELDNSKTSLPKMNSISNSSDDSKLSLTNLPVNSTPNVTDSQKKELSYKYWQLAGSGWKKDWAGRWEKDEDAEFDSDEEPPDLP